MRNYFEKFKIKKQVRKTQGYVALIAVIFTGAMLIVLSFGLNFYSFFSLADFYDFVLKEKSLSLAEGCVELALLKLKKDSLYQGDEVINIGDFSCSILPIETSDSQKIIKTSAYVYNRISNIEVVIDKETFKIISWREF